MHCLPKLQCNGCFDITKQPGMFSYKNTPALDAATCLYNNTAFMQLEQIVFA